MSSSESAKFIVNLDRNPVNSKKRKNHWKFLTSEDHRGLSNPPRTHTEINEALRDSLLYIHHAMKYTKNLVVKKGKNKNLIPNLVGEKHLYEIFNAHMLESIFYNLIKDTKYNSKQTGHVPYKYDICASEKARMMLEIALDYLLNSPEFKDRQNTIDNAKRVSEDFKLLSRSALSKEREIIEMNLSKEEKEKQIKQHQKLTNESLKLIDQLYKKFEPIMSLGNPPDSIEFNTIEKALEQTRNEIIMEMSRLKIELDVYDKKLSTKGKEDLQHENEKQMRDLNKIEDCLILIEKLQQIEYKMLELERKLYKDIKNYFCPINPITDFTTIEEMKKEVKRVIK